MEAFRPQVFVYLFERFFFRAFEFIRQWYVGSAVAITHVLFRQLKSLDRFFALKITLLHFFHPLFGDRSILGRVLGIIFRSVRVFLASIVYLVLFLFALGAYLLWVAIPLFALFQIFRYSL